MCGLFLCPYPLDKPHIILWYIQRTVTVISNTKKYYVDYEGKTMTLADFAREIGVRYDTLRSRACRNENMIAPLSTTPSEQRELLRKTATRAGGYTLEELADMYVRFCGSEDELEILADLACLRRHSSSVVKLKHSIEEYWERKRMEAQGK